MVVPTAGRCRCLVLVLLLVLGLTEAASSPQRTSSFVVAPWRRSSRRPRIGSGSSTKMGAGGRETAAAAASQPAASIESAKEDGVLPLSTAAPASSASSQQRQQQEQQQRLPTAREAVASFEARGFQPAALLRNEHWQTIWGARAIQDAFIKSVAPTLAGPEAWSDVYDRRERWETPDGDFFHADFLFSSSNSSTASSSSSSQAAAPPRPVAIVLHGLESTSTALLPRSMAKAFAAQGFDVVALNFRGCCGQDNLQPYAYHLGWTEDLAFAIRRLHGQDPRRRLFLTGFSLGGNVILKCLGELGDEAARLGVEGAAVACVPFDAVRSSGKIDAPGFNRLVYAGNFLSTLKGKAARKAAQGEVPYDMARVLACTRIGDFDDEVIAKLHGFRDKVDYYTQSCSKQYLPRIRVPALVVNALDDPFIDARGLPAQGDVGDAPVRLVYHKHGGHCGFIERGERPGTPEEDRWLPLELARFLAHVDTPFRG